MQPLFFILISIMIAACIGGITNHLAIKMLFHPRRKLILAGRKIPFTPGLIPKRKEEIARSLGKVVGDYLVTSEGLSTLIQSKEFKNNIQLKLEKWIIHLSQREETIEQMALQIWSEPQINQFHTNIVKGLNVMTTQGVEWIWEYQHKQGMKIGDLIPDWTQTKKQQFVEWIVNYIILEIKHEIKSQNGDRFIRQLTGQVMEQAGGLFGTIAGLLMDEEKMMYKVKQIIDQKLDSPNVRGLISDFLIRKVSEWEDKSLSEAIEEIAGKDGELWVLEKIVHILKWDVWLAKGRKWKLGDVINYQRKEWLLEKLPKITTLLLSLAASQIERIVAAVDLPKLVEEQVDQFPVERLEQIILSVSGREFRAITWLGAFLGGMIGLFQSIILLWYI